MTTTVQTPPAPVETDSSHIISYTFRDVAHALLVGLIVGVLTWVLAWGFTNYVFEPLLCQSSGAKCGLSGDYAAVSAQLVAAVVGLIILVRQLVFRPLLIALAATVALWGSLTIVSMLPWYGALLATGLFYSLAYALFMLLARLRSFVLAIVTLVIVVAVARLALMA